MGKLKDRWLRLEKSEKQTFKVLMGINLTLIALTIVGWLFIANSFWGLLGKILFTLVALTFTLLFILYIKKYEVITRPRRYDNLNTYDDGLHY